MTRRVGNLWTDVTAFGNLLQAARRAARGKRRQPVVATYLERLEYRSLVLQAALLDKSYRPGPTTRFVIHDPKRREITVAPFVDRVVHHALIDVVEPHFDRRMIAHTYACRRGKGTHAALDHAQRCVRHNRWFLKLDIAQCFPSLRHRVVLETVSRVVKDRDVLGLFRTVVCHPGGDADGQGLPIGHLTSQWLANLVLARLDRYATETLRVPAYLRYMDDFVLFSDDKAQLREAWTAVAHFVTAKLGVSLKTRASILAPTRDGLPFLGFRSYPALRRLRPENSRRSYRRLKTRLWEYREGLITEDQLADATRSTMAHLEAGTTRALRRRWCRYLAPRGPPLEPETR
jgi:hypothetical protein